ncbi:MAG: hypothetical protein PV344_03440 [Anaplasma sp.]|nr:hypothetical protein [Anaplasma sp.]
MVGSSARPPCCRNCSSPFPSPPRVFVYCKRLNFREDLIFAIFANRLHSRKIGPANNSGNMSRLRQLHSIREN